MIDALKTRGIKYSHVETWLLFAPPYQNFWLRAWLWHGRPSVPCTGSYSIWRDAMSNWLPFQLTWILWAPGLLPPRREISF